MLNIFIVILIGLTGKLAMGNDSITDLRALLQGLPETIGEWSRSADVAEYDTDNLYAYINGGAELYISYQFIKLISQPYVNQEEEEIKVDIFDMGSSQNAYGVFSHSHETLDDFVGTDIESEYGGGLLTFWKGRYYVSILAYPETESRKLVVQQLARRIAEQIHEASIKPHLVTLLPEDKLQPHSIRYFTHHTWMNMYHFFSTNDILHIADGAEGAMAKYTAGGTKPTVLILLHYPNETAAADAHHAFTNTFMPEAGGEYAPGADQLWTGCIRDGNLVVIVTDSPDQQAAQSLAQRVAER